MASWSSATAQTPSGLSQRRDGSVVRPASHGAEPDSVCLVESRETMAPGGLRLRFIVVVGTMDACAVSRGAPPPEPGGYGLRVGMADCKWPGRVCWVTRSSPAPARAPGPRPSHSGGVSSHRPAGPLPLWHRGIWSEELGQAATVYLAVRFKAEFRAEYRVLSASRPNRDGHIKIPAISRPNLSGRERAGFGTRFRGLAQPGARALTGNFPTGLAWPDPTSPALAG